MLAFFVSLLITLHRQNPLFLRVMHIHMDARTHTHTYTHTGFIVNMFCTCWSLADILSLAATDGWFPSPAGPHPPSNKHSHKPHLRTHSDKVWPSINQSHSWAICSYLSWRGKLKHRWALQHSSDLTDIQMERERESERAYHPSVSSCECLPLLSTLSPPLSLPPGIECSQSGRWVECIIHSLFGGLGACMYVCIWE